VVAALPAVPGVELVVAGRPSVANLAQDGDALRAHNLGHIHLATALAEDADRVDGAEAVPS
jgi:hypothetical protein